MGILPERFTAKPSVESLDSLYTQACSFGRARLYQAKDGCFFACIEFMTISGGITLEAKSNFDHKTPVDALKTAIAEAEKIKKHIH